MFNIRVSTKVDKRDLITLFNTWNCYPWTGEHENQPVYNPRSSVDFLVKIQMKRLVYETANIPHKKEPWSVKMSLQSSCQIVKKLLRVFKEKGHHFNNELRVALVLQFLKLRELIIQISLTQPKIPSIYKTIYKKKCKTEVLHYFLF